MVILLPLSFRFRKLSDKRAETNSAPFVIQEQQVERWAETNYGNSAHLLSTKRNEFDSIRMMLVVGTDHFQIFFAGSAGREIHRPNGVSLERN